MLTYTKLSLNKRFNEKLDTLIISYLRITFIFQITLLNLHKDDVIGLGYCNINVWNNVIKNRRDQYI